MSKWAITAEEDVEGNIVLPLPSDMLGQLEWYEGDVLDFRINDSESCSIVNLSWEERQRKNHQG